MSGTAAICVTFGFILALAIVGAAVETFCAMRDAWRGER